MGGLWGEKKKGVLDFNPLSVMAFVPMCAPNVTLKQPCAGRAQVFAVVCTVWQSKYGLQELMDGKNDKMNVTLC